MFAAVLFVILLLMLVEEATEVVDVALVMLDMFDGGINEVVDVVLVMLDMFDVGITEVVDVVLVMLDMFDVVLLIVVLIGDVKDVACIEHDDIVDGIVVEPDGTLSAILTGVGIITNVGLGALGGIMYVLDMGAVCKISLSAIYAVTGLGT